MTVVRAALNLMNAQKLIKGRGIIQTMAIAAIRKRIITDYLEKRNRNIDN